MRPRKHRMELSVAYMSNLRCKMIWLSVADCVGLFSTAISRKCISEFVFTRPAVHRILYRSSSDYQPVNYELSTVTFVFGPKGIKANVLVMSRSFIFRVNNTGDTDAKN